MSNINKYIIYFDGVCGLCNRFVNFLIKIDKDDIYRFATLQSEAAKKLNIDEVHNLSTVVFQEHNKIRIKSNAVIHILYHKGGAWKLIILLKLFPRFLRDFVYDFVAKKRYKWFGKNNNCRVPTKTEQVKFLT